MLGHFTNITPSVNLEETVYLNLFEVTFTFPSILGVNAEMNYMMQQATNIKLDLTPKLQTLTQAFKYSKRAYVKTPETTIYEFDIKFNVNVDNKFSMKSWNLLKKWYDLAWNSQTGELHYKRDMIGSIVAHLHDREGVVIRRTEFKNVQLLGISGMELGFDSSNVFEANSNFVADYVIDQYFDIQA